MIYGIGTRFRYLGDFLVEIEQYSASNVDRGAFTPYWLSILRHLVGDKKVSASLTEKETWATNSNAVRAPHVGGYIWHTPVNTPKTK